MPPQFNILNGWPTLQLGTFEYYREMESSSSLIADPDEGTETTYPDFFESSTASKEALEHVNRFFGCDLSDSHFMIQGGSMTSIFQNSYIWCCSKVSKPVPQEKGIRMDPSYTDFYEINDPNRFAQYIGRVLFDSLLNIPFADSAKPIIDGLRLSEMKDQIDVRWYHGPVVYVERRRSVIYENQMISDFEHIPPFFRPIFVKSNRYEEQDEYRFVFYFQHKHHGPLAVQKEPHKIPISLDSLAGGNMEFVNQSFKNQKIDLDYNSFEGCNFTSCTLVYHGHGSVFLSRCEFHQVAWKFSDSAEKVLGFLGALYHGGGKELIEETFTNIRKGPPTPPEK